MLRWSSIAPFDTPVVPPVYCRNAMSSCPVGNGFRSLPAPSASTSFQRSAPGRSNAGTIFFTLRTTKFTISPLTPSMSPSETTMVCFTGVRARTSSRVWAKFSRMTIASAPESLSWCSSSRAVYSGLTLTTVYPARSAPYRPTGYCSMFGIISATRAPFCSPFACSHAPKSRDNRSSSAKLMVRPMQWNAGRSANCLAHFSNSSPTDW